MLDHQLVQIAHGGHAVRRLQAQLVVGGQGHAVAAGGAQRALEGGVARVHGAATGLPRAGVDAQEAALESARISYQATVDIDQHVGNPDTIPETPVAQLPLSALAYIYPSRYCQSDRLANLAMREFGLLDKGYLRVEAVRNWVNQYVTFRGNTSNSATSALDTLIDRVGVCRDFAHLMIAICRALSIPARFTTGIDYGADPALGPTDFHAYVEVFLGGRWYLFDPSGTAIPMGFIRLGTGRDAADVSFATIFGGVASLPPLIAVSAITEPGRPWEMPRHRPEALSTDAVDAG